MQLRQVALVAGELSPIRRSIFRLLGLEADFADHGVAEFGLENSVMTVGDTFLEVVAPMREGTTAGRLLERRGGDGGYMVLLQVENIDEVNRRIEALGIRKVWETERDEVSAFHVHPRDIGAAIVSFDEMRPAAEWLWAGPGWRERAARHVSGISGVTLQALDPLEIADRWSKALDVQAVPVAGGFILTLDKGEIRIEESEDGRGDGVVAIRFDTSALDQIEKAAESLGLAWQDGELDVCGTRFQFRVV